MDAVSAYDSDESDEQKKNKDLNRSEIVVAPEINQTQIIMFDSTDKELYINPKCDEIFAPIVGPENPFKSQKEKIARNTYNGFIQDTYVNETMFELQRRNFTALGEAIDPSSNTLEPKIIYKKYTPSLNTDVDFRKIKKEPRGDPGDIENFKGPWANYLGINQVAKPSDEQFKILEEQRLERLRRKAENLPDEVFDFNKRHDLDDPTAQPASANEKFILHINNPYDYQGRSFLHVPTDVDVNLKSTNPPNECFPPKKHIHTWKAHAKGVSLMKLFPKSGHLVLSGGMDTKIKLLLTYEGHKEAINDLCFNNEGTQFLSSSFDKWIKLWDTETGQCIQRFTSNRIPYCVKFNPNPVLNLLDKQHFFIAGFSDFKMLTWDIRENSIVQEYDRHLGPVNTITFFDHNQRLLTTSDDKSIRVWEWDIPVDSKYIADPSMHSIPAVTLSPCGNWLAGQSMGNRIVVYDLANRVRERRKGFKGHLNAGYACQLDFSPDGKYIISGDSQGKLNIWLWENRFDAHKKVSIGALWLPHEESKILTCSWDGFIKMWA